jgi:uncharacterized protein YdeI (YjbR/CyaY-like superfamily)
MAKVAVAKVKSFKAVLEKSADGLGWTIARVPFEPREAWPSMLRLRVRGEVNGVSVRTSLFPVAGGGGYFVLVNKTVQREAGLVVGSAADFLLEPDMEPREAELPDELAALLEGEDGLRDYYDSLSEYTRREIGKWVVGVKTEAAQMKRSQEMAERLLTTMEAEKELPQYVAAAFRRRPKAKAGWGKLTPTQRRMELFAVTYYKTPESRAKRVEKLCDAAEKKAITS